MKKTSIIILAALLGATLHTGCKKAENTDIMAASAKTPVAPQSDRMTTVITATSAFDYQLIVKPSTQQSPFQWQKGQISAAELIFRGGLMEGAPQNIRPVTFSRQINEPFQLFNPIDLGLLNVGRGLYNNMELEVRLSSSNGPALVLGGTYNMKGTLLNVQLIVEDDLHLAGKVQGPLNIGTSKYTALLSLNIDDIINGASADLINNAVITTMQNGNSIIISRQFNPQLYQAMLTGLLNLPVNVQLVPVFTTNNNTYIKVAQVK